MKGTLHSEEGGLPVYIPLNDHTVLFQTISFSINRLFALSWNTKQFYLAFRWDSIRCYFGLEWTLEQWQWRGTSHSPNSSVAGASPSDCFMSDPGYSLRESWSSAEMQLVYSTAPAKWRIKLGYEFIERS